MTTTPHDELVELFREAFTEEWNAATRGGSTRDRCAERAALIVGPHADDVLSSHYGSEARS